MSDNGTGHYEGALLEEIRDKVKAIHEYVAPLESLPGDVAQLKEDMSDVKGRLANVEFAVTDLAKDMRQLNKRVTGLEGTVFS
jgi:predicted  nucleic acid-binding Zn-ribbon protein